MNRSKMLGALHRPPCGKSCCCYDRGRRPVRRLKRRERQTWQKEARSA